MKEAPLFFFFGLLIHLLMKMYQGDVTRKNWIFMGGLLLILFHLKFYVGLMLLPILTLHLIRSKWPTFHFWWATLLNYGSYFALAIAWHFIRWKWSLFTVLKWKKKDFEGLALEVQANSYWKGMELEDNPISFLMNLPFGLFNSLVRPFYWEAKSIFVRLSAIESSLIVLVLLMAALLTVKGRNSVVGKYALLYALTFLMIVGMVTPIAGSLVRYKIPALPFLFFFFIERLDLPKFKALLKIKEKR